MKHILLFFVLVLGVQAQAKLDLVACGLRLALQPTTTFSKEEFFQEYSQEIAAIKKQNQIDPEKIVKEEVDQAQSLKTGEQFYLYKIDVLRGQDQNGRKISRYYFAVTLNRQGIFLRRYFNLERYGAQIRFGSFVQTSSGEVLDLKQTSILKIIPFAGRVISLSKEDNPETFKPSTLTNLSPYFKSKFSSELKSLIYQNVFTISQLKKGQALLAWSLSSKEKFYILQVPTSNAAEYQTFAFTRQPFKKIFGRNKRWMPLESEEVYSRMGQEIHVPNGEIQLISSDGLTNSAIFVPKIISVVDKQGLLKPIQHSD